VKSSDILLARLPLTTFSSVVKGVGHCRGKGIVRKWEVVGSIPGQGRIFFLINRQNKIAWEQVKQKCFTKLVARIYEVVKLQHFTSWIFTWEDHRNQVTSQQQSWRQRSKWTGATCSHFVRLKWFVSGYVNDSLCVWAAVSWIFVVTVNEGFICNWQRFTPLKVLTYGCGGANSDVVRCFYPIAS
jgi:hypothetical protein